MRQRILLSLLAIILVLVGYRTATRVWPGTSQPRTVVSPPAGNNGQAAGPRRGQVTAVDVMLPGPVVSEWLPQRLEINNGGERLVIDQLMSWLQAGIALGPGKPEPFLCRPMGLTLHLADGGVEQVFVACDCFVEPQGQMTKISCNRAEGQVIYVPAGGGQPLRLQAPQLFDWLEHGGWERDVRRLPAGGSHQA